MSDRLSRMLDCFEKKHGDYYQLLARYVEAKYPGGNERESSRLERLMRSHDKLVWGCMGYHEGYKAGLEAGKTCSTS